MATFPLTFSINMLAFCWGTFERRDSFTFGLFAPDLYNQAFVVVFLSIPKSFLKKSKQSGKRFAFFVKSFVKSVKREGSQHSDFLFAPAGAGPVPSHLKAVTYILTEVRKGRHTFRGNWFRKGLFFCMYVCVPSRVLHGIKLQFFRIKMRCS